MSDSEAEYQAKVVYDFVANTDNELNIQAGEVVTVLEEDDPWAHVKNISGIDGYVPMNYLERMEEPMGGPPPPPRPNMAAPTERTERTARGILSSAFSDSDRLPPTPKTPAPAGYPRGRGKSMDNSPAWNILASSLEWWCCLTLFISGIFTLMWGSSQVPEDRLRETLGTFCCIASALLLIYFSMFRESWAEKAAILRGGILLVISILCWISWPLGTIAAGPVTLAAMANFMVWFKRSALLKDAQIGNDQWLTLSFNVGEVFKTSWGALVFLFLHLGANTGYYILGVYIGDKRIEDELLENNLVVGKSHRHAEGWGVIIAMNLVWLFLFSLYGLHDYLIEWAQLRADEEGFCIKNLNRTILWLFLDKRQLFLHRIFATTILIASVAHMFESYNSWETSGSSRDYFEVFGQETFVTGVIVVWCEILIFAAVSPELVQRNRDMFTIIHSTWGLLVIALVCHGRKGLGRNFWKFIVGPMGLYMMDRLFRSGGNAALRMQDLA